MFRQIRYQTGEIDDVIKEMRNGAVPSMDVDDNEELDWVINQLTTKGVYRVPSIPPDKNARNPLDEPEFEFRIAFLPNAPSSDEVNPNELMYIDFYFEPIDDDTYDPVGEM